MVISIFKQNLYNFVKPHLQNKHFLTKFLACQPERNDRLETIKSSINRL